jgi:CubicO group peptidase (beta-lactamase class C family)
VNARGGVLPDELERDLRRRVRTFQSRRRVPSVVAGVALEGELRFAHAVGLARVEPAQGAGAEHQYRIGSITKTFTAVAIMQLRDEGLLELDDPVARHVAEAPAGPTIARLLTHLSGIQREIPGQVWETLEAPSREEILARLEDAEQVLAPDARWHYSNLAFALLGEVAERLRGEPYERVVERRILTPLGLGRTSFEPREPYAHGYLVRPYTDEVELEPLVRLRGDSSAGQLWSTAGDLVRWAMFLVRPDEEVLRARSAEEMHAPRAVADPERLERAWGLGLEIGRRAGRTLAGHGGAMPGFLAELVYAREERAAAVVLANTTAGAPVEELARELLDRALEALPPEPEPWRPDGGPPAELRSALGRWWTEAEEWIFAYRNGRLEARAADAEPGREPAVFAPDGPDRFRVASGREQGEPLLLARDEAGTVTKMYWATYPLTREPRPFGVAGDAR